MIRREACVVQPAHQQALQDWRQAQGAGAISYLTQGQGVPIVFLHGIGGAARQFEGQLTHFGGARRAIAWDMPGYGDSAPLPLTTMDGLAAALGGFIAALGLDRPILVGHSIGGMIVQRLVAEAPHIARALVLAQTSAAFGGRDPAWAEAFIRERLGPLDEGRSMASLAPAMVAAMLGDDPDPAGVALAQDCIAHTPDGAYRDTVLAMPGFDQRDALPRIVAPTLVLAGGKDPNAPAAAMQRMADRIPGARFVVLDGVGHLAHLEQPARFNAALDEFLQDAAP
jgi:3-oxoadipate enol-lactonase